jgi:hypothetical protein
MATLQNGELAHEYEDELLAELSHETGPAHEGHPELNSEFEFETTAHETAHEYEFEHELGANELHELTLGEASFEGEQFFKKFRGLARGIGRFVKTAAPLLRQVAKVAAPMVATAVGGPFGNIIGQVASKALGEEETLGEYEFETAFTNEAALPESQHEIYEGAAQEVLPELGANEYEQPEAGASAAMHEVLAEVLAESAAGAQHEYEAEAMAGAAAVTVLTAADRAALRRILPHLLRGVAVLTQILRRRRMTRPAVRTVPTIFRTTVRDLRRRAAAGQPITRRTAGLAMANATRRVLANPRICGGAILGNARTAMRANRPVSG